MNTWVSPPKLKQSNKSVDSTECKSPCCAPRCKERKRAVGEDYGGVRTRTTARSVSHQCKRTLLVGRCCNKRKGVRQIQAPVVALSNCTRLAARDLMSKREKKSRIEDYRRDKQPQNHASVHTPLACRRSDNGPLTACEDPRR
jgi:hypothetical protein